MKKLFFLVAAMAATTMAFAQTTVTKTISDLVTEQELTISTNGKEVVYTSLQIDEVVTMSTSGTPNCGSIWGTAPNNEWRLYHSQNGDVTISVKENFELVSITLTYGINKNGFLKDGPASGTATDVSGNSVTYLVDGGDNAAGTNGQVKIKAISVTYKEKATTALENAEVMSIYAENGRIFGAENARIYTINGQDVTAQNGQLNGIYVVKSADKATKIVVR